MAFLNFLKKNAGPVVGQTLVTLLTLGAVFTGWSGEKPASAVLLGIVLLLFGANLWVIVHYRILEERPRDVPIAHLRPTAGVRLSIEDEAQARALEVWVQVAMAYCRSGVRPETAMAGADAVALLYEQRLIATATRMRNEAAAMATQPAVAEAKASEGSN